MTALVERPVRLKPGFQRLWTASFHQERVFVVSALLNPNDENECTKGVYDEDFT